MLRNYGWVLQCTGTVTASNYYAVIGASALTFDRLHVWQLSDASKRLHDS
jgi:hypothetical protein